MEGVAVSIRLLCLCVCWVFICIQSSLRKHKRRVTLRRTHIPIWTKTTTFIHTKNSTVNQVTFGFFAGEKQITTLCPDLSDWIYGRWQRPPTQSCCWPKTVQTTKTRWPASQMLSRLLIRCECCPPQEFSDEDAEEDIDALMSAHNKTPRRRLSNAMSTVTSTLKLVQTQKYDKHMPGGILYAPVQYKQCPCTLCIHIVSLSPDEWLCVLVTV